MIASRRDERTPNIIPIAPSPPSPALSPSSPFEVFQARRRATEPVHDDIIPRNSLAFPPSFFSPSISPLTCVVPLRVRPALALQSHPLIRASRLSRRNGQDSWPLCSASTTAFYRRSTAGFGHALATLRETGVASVCGLAGLRAGGQDKHSYTQTHTPTA